MRLDVVGGVGHARAGGIPGAGEKTTELSLFYFGSGPPTTGRPTYRLLLEGARRADAAGMTAVWMPERHFHPFGGIYPNPAVTAAAIAALTDRIQIRAGSVVAPLHDPIRIGEEWSVVDNLSDGRVGISFASGWQPIDFALAPEAYAERRSTLADTVNTVRRLWAGEAITRTDGTGRPVELRLMPIPVQPELPVWITSSGSAETFRLAGALRANLLTHLLGQSLDELAGKIATYRSARRDADGGIGHVTLMLHSFLHEDDLVARDIAREPFIAYLRTSYDLVAQWAERVSGTFDPATVSDDDLDFLLGRAFDRYYNDSGLFGSPAAGGAMLDRLDNVGIDEVACLVDFGIDEDLVLESIDLLGELASSRARH